MGITNADKMAAARGCEIQMQILDSGETEVPAVLTLCNSLFNRRLPRQRFRSPPSEPSALVLRIGSGRRPAALISETRVNGASCVANQP